MIIIAGNSNVSLSKKIADRLGCKCIIANTLKFPNQELKIQISVDLSGQDVIIIQSINEPVHDNLMELLLLADTVKKSACRNITAIIPYMAYSRQDRPSYKSGPIAIGLMAKLIEVSGIDNIITVDIHSQVSKNCFNFGIENLDPIDVFLSNIKIDSNYVVVSPDAGSIYKAKSLACKLNSEFAVIDKYRDNTGKCKMLGITGDVHGKDCVIIDDIVDTGSTLCEAAKMLKNHGCSSIIAFVTHGLFSDNCLSNIKESGIYKLFITDTISHKDLPCFIDVSSVYEIISQCILKSVNAV